MRRDEALDPSENQPLVQQPPRVVRLSKGILAGLVSGLAAVLGFTTVVAIAAPPEAAPPHTAPVAAAATPAPGTQAPVDPAAAVRLAERLMALKPAPTTSRIERGPVDARIPARLLAAYRTGEAITAQRSPQCHLPWWLLAGIGRVESGHAAGGSVDARGVTTWPIRGPRLDGTTPGTAVITDSDGGAIDGDPLFDRAVGPMQFLPGTWNLSGVDGNADGRLEPDQVDDAAASAGAYLCSGGEDLRDPAAMARAILRYNASTQYLEDVLAGGVAYRDGRPIPVPDMRRRATTAVPRPPATEATRPTATPTPTTPSASSDPSGTAPTLPTTGAARTPAPTADPSTGTPTSGAPAPSTPPTHGQPSPGPTTTGPSPETTGAPRPPGSAPAPRGTPTGPRPGAPSSPAAPVSPTCIPVTPTADATEAATATTTADATATADATTTATPTATPTATATAGATATATLPPCPTPTRGADGPPTGAR